MTHIVYSNLLAIGKDCWKMVCKSSHLASESYFALFVQDVRRRYPLPDEGLPRLNQLLVRGVAHVLAVVEIRDDRFHALEHDAGPTAAQRAEHRVGVPALVLPTEKPTRSVGGDSLLAHQLGKVLSPGLQHEGKRGTTGHVETGAPVADAFSTGLIPGLFGIVQDVLVARLQRP